MPMNLYIFEMHIYFSGYDSVHFAPRYAAKNEPTGVDAHPCDDALPSEVWYESIAVVHFNYIGLSSSSPPTPRATPLSTTLGLLIFYIIE